MAQKRCPDCGAYLDPEERCDCSHNKNNFTLPEGTEIHWIEPKTDEEIAQFNLVQDLIQNSLLKNHNHSTSF